MNLYIDLSKAFPFGPSSPADGGGGVPAVKAPKGVPALGGGSKAGGIQAPQADSQKLVACPLNAGEMHKPDSAKLKLHTEQAQRQGQAKIKQPEKTSGPQPLKVNDPDKKFNEAMNVASNTVKPPQKPLTGFSIKPEDYSDTTHEGHTALAAAHKQIGSDQKLIHFHEEQAKQKGAGGGTADKPFNVAQKPTIEDPNKPFPQADHAKTLKKLGHTDREIKNMSPEDQQKHAESGQIKRPTSATAYHKQREQRLQDTHGHKSPEELRQLADSKDKTFQDETRKPKGRSRDGAHLRKMASEKEAKASVEKKTATAETKKTKAEVNKTKAEVKTSAAAGKAKAEQFAKEHESKATKKIDATKESGAHKDDKGRVLTNKELMDKLKIEVRKPKTDGEKAAHLDHTGSAKDLQVALESHIHGGKLSPEHKERAKALHAAAAFHSNIKTHPTAQQRVELKHLARRAKDLKVDKELSYDVDASDFESDLDTSDLDTSDLDTKADIRKLRMQEHKGKASSLKDKIQSHLDNDPAMDPATKQKLQDIHQLADNHASVDSHPSKEQSQELKELHGLAGAHGKKAWEAPPDDSEEFHMPSTAEDHAKVAAHQASAKQLKHNLQAHMDSGAVEPGSPEHTKVQHLLSAIGDHEGVSNIPSNEQASALKELQKIAGDHGKPPKPGKEEPGQPKGDNFRNEFLRKLSGSFHSGRAAGAKVAHESAHIEGAGALGSQMLNYTASGAVNAGHYLLHKDKKLETAKPQAQGSAVQQASMKTTP